MKDNKVTQIKTQVLEAEDNKLRFNTVFEFLGRTIEAQVEMHDENETIEYFLN